MGANAGQTFMNLAKGGLTGVGQGLAQQNNPNPQFNFSALQQGFQQQRKKPQAAINGNQSPFPSGPNPNSQNTSIYG